MEDKKLSKKTGIFKSLKVHERVLVYALPWIMILPLVENMKPAKHISPTPFLLLLLQAYGAFCFKIALAVSCCMVFFQARKAMVEKEKLFNGWIWVVLYCLVVLSFYYINPEFGIIMGLLLVAYKIKCGTVNNAYHKRWDQIMDIAKMGLEQLKESKDSSLLGEVYNMALIPHPSLLNFWQVLKYEQLQKCKKPEFIEWIHFDRWEQTFTVKINEREERGTLVQVCNKNFMHLDAIFLIRDTVSILARQKQTDESGNVKKDEHGNDLGFLSGANLNFLWLQGANVSGANFQGASMEFVNLQGANIQGANLQQASMFDANLQGADMSNANIKDACMHYANLQGACLRNANLQGANFLLDEHIQRYKGDVEYQMWKNGRLKGKTKEEIEKIVEEELPKVIYEHHFKDMVVEGAEGLEEAMFDTGVLELIKKRSDEIIAEIKNKKK